jgi:hypothetical protein
VLVIWSQFDSVIRFGCLAFAIRHSAASEMVELKKNQTPLVSSARISFNAISQLPPDLPSSSSKGSAVAVTV